MNIFFFISEDDLRDNRRNVHDVHVHDVHVHVVHVRDVHVPDVRDHDVHHRRVHLIPTLLRIHDGDVLRILLGPRQLQRTR